MRAQEYYNRYETGFDGCFAAAETAEGTCVHADGLEISPDERMPVGLVKLVQKRMHQLEQSWETGYQPRLFCVALLVLYTTCGILNADFESQV